MADREHPAGKDQSMRMPWSNIVFKISLAAVTLLGAALFPGPVWAGDMTFQTSEKVAAYFEKAKENESTLIAFLHKMPKGGDLHNHLYGDIEAEDILASAVAQGLFFDRAEKEFVEKKPENPHFTAEEMTDIFWHRAEILEAISMRNTWRSGESGHEHFFRSFFRFIRALPEDSAMMREAMIRAVNQRLSYVEFMTYPVSPAHVAEVEKIRREVLADFAKDGLDWNLEIRYIYPLDRNSDLSSFQEQLQEALEAFYNPEMKTVAITMLSPEDAHISQRDFLAQMAVLDNAWKDYDARSLKNPNQYPTPPVFTLHAGELTLEYAAYRSMLDRISKSIELGHASRIGHGVSIIWENDVYGLLKMMRDRKIPVEICLTSNKGILDVSGGGRHPFKLYREAGVPLVIATDDEGLSRSNMTIEYGLAAHWFKLSYGEIKWLAMNSLEYSFLPGESLFMEGDFNKMKEKPESIVKTSEKAKMQENLLKAFADFEKDMEKVIDDFGW
ncbi:hypothetical protein C4J81_05820 [Deltaproteobacteria bacterium Smac51]|nr:hypothetical protein C4J81_05820 [Deltaproteobacteria bacterium Smac51]